MQGLSDRQRSILGFIHQRLTEDGVQPSYREIGNAMGIRSTNGVSDHIKALIRKGYLQRRGGTGKAALARSLTLTDAARSEFGEQVIPAANEAFSGVEFAEGEVIEIGVYGQVAAGALARKVVPGMVVRGALVAMVMPDTPADRGGIERGDVIVEFDGRAIEEWKDLPLVVASTPVDKKAKVVVRVRVRVRIRVRIKVRVCVRTRLRVKIRRGEGVEVKPP